jgi:uncharacterized RDD family membrane protein YckC
MLVTIAKRRARIAAYLVDLIINTLVIFLFLLATTSTEIIAIIWGNPTGIVFDMLLFIKVLRAGMFIMGYLTFYSVVLPYLNKGQTVGKRLFHLRVVRMDDFKADFICLMMREMVGKYLLSIATLFASPFISFALISYRPDRRSIHDIIANTKVVDAV